MKFKDNHILWKYSFHQREAWSLSRGGQTERLANSQASPSAETQGLPSRGQSAQRQSRLLVRYNIRGQRHRRSFALAGRRAAWRVGQSSDLLSPHTHVSGASERRETVCSILEQSLSRERRDIRRIPHKRWLLLARCQETTDAQERTRSHYWSTLAHSCSSALGLLFSCRVLERHSTLQVYCCFIRAHT